MLMLVQWNKASCPHGEMLMVLYVVIYYSSCGICTALYAFIGIWSYVAAKQWPYRYSIVYRCGFIPCWVWRQETWHLQCICILILDYGRKASLVWGFGRVSEKLRFSKGWWWLIFILYEDTSLVGIISLPWWLLIFTTYAFISIVGHIPWLIVGWHITYV